MLMEKKPCFFIEHDVIHFNHSTRFVLYFGSSNWRYHYEIYVLSALFCSQNVNFIMFESFFKVDKRIEDTQSVILLHRADDGAKPKAYAKDKF